MFQNVLEYLLQINDLSLFPVIKCKDNLVSGKEYWITTSIENVDPWPSRETTLEFYLYKKDKLKKKEAILLASDTIPPISANNSRKWKTKVEIPGDLKPTKYYLHAIINAGGDFQELNTSNNKGYKRITVK